MYLYKDKDKTRARDRYIVVSTDTDWLFIRKFTGQQLRNASYKIKRTECYKVPAVIQPHYPSTECSQENEEFEIITPNLNDQIDKPIAQMSSDPIALPPIPADIVPNLDDINSQVPISNVDSDSTEPAENDTNASSSSRPQRIRQPPNKLTLKWDNSKTYV